MRAVAGARHYKELRCWQMARELKLAVYRLLERRAVESDWKFKNQLMDAAASVPSNIAEGFVRRTNADFAHFLDIARSSLAECCVHLEDGVDRRYWSSAECEPHLQMADRTIRSVSRLQGHLRRRPRRRE
jgi:four helix bundle protein